MNGTMVSKYKLAFSLAGLILVLDQVTKALIRQHMPLWTRVEVIPGFFDLVHTLNRGAAFGFLNRDDMRWQVYFFIATGSLAVVIIVHLLRTAEGGRLLRAGLGLILGGALGNLADRVRLGEVVDFLDFYMGKAHWPAFNVADSGITVGSVLLLIALYTQRHVGRGPA